MADLQKAGQLKAAALKKGASSGGFFGSMFGGGGSSRFEEASEMYTQAANIYKIGKKWKDAGECYVESANMLTKAEIPHEAATAYVSASKAFNKCDSKLAVDVAEEAAKLYVNMGRLSMAAKQMNSVAEMYETQLVDLPKAVEKYDTAAEYFDAEDSKSPAAKARIKIAHLSALLEDFTKAAQVFEEVGLAMAENSLLKWSAKEMFMKAALCFMASGDVVDAQRRLEEYDGSFAGFRDSREQKLVKSLAGALEEADVDAYTQAVADYDAISPLDDWMTKVLLTIKKTMDEDDLR